MAKKQEAPVTTAPAPALAPPVPSYPPVDVEGSIKHIVEQSWGPNQGTHVPPNVAAAILAQHPGFLMETVIEPNANGFVHYVATQAATDYTSKNGSGSVALPPTGSTPIPAARTRAPQGPPISTGTLFVPSTPLPMPTTVRGGGPGREGIYTKHFEALQAMGCFLIPCELSDVERLKKLMSHTAAAQNNKFAPQKKGVPTGKDGRKFVVRALKGFDARAYGYEVGPFIGVGVWRIK